MTSIKGDRSLCPTIGHGFSIGNSEINLFVETWSSIAMQDYERQIKLKFKLFASFYDLFDVVFLLDREKNPRRALARKIPNGPLRILDVCIGTANSTIAVAESNSRNKVIGVDLSPYMITVANNKIRKRGIRNIFIYEMDATKMVFKDCEFDIVMVSFALHEMNYELMMALLKEMSRVLKEGGTLYIIDYERKGGLIKNFIFSIFLKLFEPRHMPAFLKYDWTKILRSIGFRITEVESHLFSKLICAIKVPSELHHKCRGV